MSLLNQEIDYSHDRKKSNLAIKQQDKFSRNIIHNGALASNDISNTKFDLKEAKSLCSEGISALGAQNGLESMLAAQMLSVHQLQQ